MSELPFASMSKRVEVPSHSHNFPYRFINSFLWEMFCINARFETEAKGNIHPWAAHRSLWFLSLVSAQKKLGLVLHLRCKAEFEKLKRKQAGNEYNKDVWKLGFRESTEAVWRPKCDAPESNNVSTKVDQSVTKQQLSLQQRSNYVPVHQCTENWNS